MKHVIIGTAGHVDHGKTTLIHALTGTNPDRLKEEQERGMTIDIGFAALTLPDGTRVGIVDVPGHERFLKNMLAGATGVDVALLVVAADESVMPQTKEHLDILRLLDIPEGVVALTKCDLVEDSWLSVVEDDIRAHTKGTFLEKAPIVRVSAVKGMGLERLRHALLSAVSRVRSRETGLPYRLPIDRVFTLQGFGTVVTGTLVSGILQVGDAVEILPQKLLSRVRGLQVHGQKVEAAEAGSRVAVNLVNVPPDKIERGSQLVAPQAYSATSLMYASFYMLENAPKALTNHTRVRLYIGTAEVLGRVRILTEEGKIAPGERAFLQFRAEHPFVCARGDRFVLRTYSPLHLLGGGVVLDPTPAPHKKITTELLNSLKARERRSPEEMVLSLLISSPYGLSLKELTGKLGLTEAQVERILQPYLGKEIVAFAGNHFFHTVALNTLSERMNHLLTQYHFRYPLRLGMPKEELKNLLGFPQDGKLFNLFLRWCTEKGLIRAEASHLRLPNFVVQLNENQERLLQRIEQFYRECDLFVPSIQEVSSAVKAPPDAVMALLRIGVEQGRFVKIGEGLYYHFETLQRLKNLVRDHILQHGSITVANLRDITQTNRKVCLQALEYLDSIGYTRRVDASNRVLSP